MNQILRDPLMASWIQSFIYLFTLLVLIYQTRTLAEQTKNQEKTIMLQIEAMRTTEYLGYLNDWTEMKRSLLINDLYTKINDNLMNQYNNKYLGWGDYSPQDKMMYGYFELIYDYFERIFILQEQKWISQEEWTYWLNWLKEIMYHPVFGDVHSNNLGMYNRNFQNFISEELKKVEDTPR